MCQPAREDAEAHFLNVLRSFTEGHAVDNIDDVHKLDGKVWEHKNGVHFNPFAVEQRWGCFTTRGYQQLLGVGRSLSASVLKDYPSVMACHHYMRHYLAFLHGCTPEALCWKPEGVSIKGRGQGAAPPHRDCDSHGRFQCVLALAPGAFDVWPRSHTVKLRCDQHHLGDADMAHLQSKCAHLVCACEPGDVLIFSLTAVAIGF